MKDQYDFEIYYNFLCVIAILLLNKKIFSVSVSDAQNYFREFFASFTDQGLVLKRGAFLLLRK